MVPTKYVFLALLTAICLYAFWRGRGDERVAAVVCVLATIATHFALSNAHGRYGSTEYGVLLVDLAVLAAFVALALHSDRFWPLWIAGLQLTTSLAHILKTLEGDLIPLAYAAAGRFWSYPILLIVAIGTWRGHRRRLQAREAGFAA